MFNTYRVLGAFAAIILCSFSIVFAYSGGSGEPNDPYQIATVADWQQFMNTDSDCNKCFILTADIDLQGVSLKPIGWNEPYVGIFDGNNHIISNATMKNPITNYDGIGLFSNLRSSGQIRNLGLEDVNIIGDHCVGGLLGWNYNGSISNCYSTGIVRSFREVGGLLVGYSLEGLITNCSVAGSVFGGNYYTGGLIGRNEASTVSDCCSTCTITAANGSQSVGGLIGNNVGPIVNCHASGNISLGNYSYGHFIIGSGNYVGGLIGTNLSYEVIGCSATGTITLRDGLYIGGLIGDNSGPISNCYASVDVNDYHSAGPVQYVGGLAGSQSGDVTNSFAKGNVNTKYISGTDYYGEYVGGLIGGHSEFRNSNNHYVNCYATGNVNGAEYVGGLIGDNYLGTVTDSYATGAVSGDEDYIGGLVGNNQNSSITRCYASGTVTGGAGSFQVGGLVGGNLDNSSIFECYASGSINNAYEAGGLAGRNSISFIAKSYATGQVFGDIAGGLTGGNEGVITDCYATGAASGNSSGGLAGYNGYGGEIFNCYSTGAVDGNLYEGGLIGVFENGNVNASFWDVNTSGLTDGAGSYEPGPDTNGVTGLTTSQMQDMDTFVNAGWDFSYDDGDEADWFIQINEYPILTWQISPADIYTDGRNDFRDFVIFAQYWMRGDCRVYNDYCEWSDLNFDGYVDIDDLFELMSYWLEEGIYN